MSDERQDERQSEQKPGDPADRAADGAFGGVHSHRAGYGGNVLDGRVYTREEWIERNARLGGTLAAGEGKVLVAELDRLRAAVVEGMTKVTRAERVLAALREPSAGVLAATVQAVGSVKRFNLKGIICAAVAAAEEEVNPNPYRFVDEEEG